MKKLTAILQEKIVGIVFMLAVATGACLFTLNAAVAVQEERSKNMQENQNKQYQELYDKLEKVRVENREEHRDILDLLNKK